MNKIFNEDMLVTTNRNELLNAIDCVVTSPPYNTSRSGASDDYNRRYNSYVDNLSDEKYIEKTIEFFNGYDKILKKNGVICYNISYSSERTHLIWLVIAEIIRKTNFTTADCIGIVWKKSSAIPNNRSKNKLTRICEFVFIFVRKKELDTFFSNKKVVSVIEKTGQNNYENIFNFIEAKNNDGSNPLNKATFSTELVTKLLDMYCPLNGLVYDSFMGIGTTAKAALLSGRNFYGSELDENQVEYANNAINKILNENKFF